MTAADTSGQHGNQAGSCMHNKRRHDSFDRSTDGALRWNATDDIDPIDVLCRRIVTIQPCDIPRSLAHEVEADIRRCIAALDQTLSRDSVRALYNTLLRVGGRSESRIGGRGLRLPAHEAAALNVAACWMSDRDDRRFVVPAVWSALATFDALGGVSAEAFTTAIALSIDLGCRLHRATPDAGALGHHDAIYSGFVAAACAAKLRSFALNDLRNALGIMLSQAAGTMQAAYDRANGDDLLIALGVGDGLRSVMLANVGVTGVRRVISGEFGFLKLFSKCGDERLLVSDPDQIWAVCDRYPLTSVAAEVMPDTVESDGETSSHKDIFCLFERLFPTSSDATGNNDE